MVSRALQIEFTISTRGAGLYEFTGDVCRWVNSIAGDGLLTLFVRHTSCSLLIHENADTLFLRGFNIGLSNLVLHRSIHFKFLVNTIVS